jgi:hypothetical protein
MNAVGGGGSFVTLPALIGAGVPSVSANASSSVALFPGSIASTWAGRDRLVSVGDVSLRLLVVVTASGGLVGAALLVVTPPDAFAAAVPWLLLSATLIFAAGPKAGAVLRGRLTLTRKPLLVAQFVVGIYGGYFGGAVGIMMLAIWSLFSAADVHVMNPAKTLLLAASRAIAVIVFIATGTVAWRQTVPVLLAGIAGGYIAAWAGQRIGPRVIRASVIIVMTAITIAFFAGPM